MASADTLRCSAVSSRSLTCAGGKQMARSPGCCSITAQTRMPVRSLRKRLRFVPDESMHEYRDVTPLAWGERFHGPGSHGHTWVSKEAMELIAESGGHF